MAMASTPPGSPKRCTGPASHRGAPRNTAAITVRRQPEPSVPSAEPLWPDRTTPRQPGGERREDVHEDARAVDLDPRVGRGTPAGPHEVGVAPPSRPLDYTPKDQDASECDVQGCADAARLRGADRAETAPSPRCRRCVAGLDTALPRFELSDSTIEHAPGRTRPAPVNALPPSSMATSSPTRA